MLGIMKYINEQFEAGGKYIARFNLGTGENFMKWQIYKKGSSAKEAKFYAPETTSFIFENCYLRNHCSTAEKIHQGANKTVCAWIEFDRMTIITPDDTIKDTLTPINYNPKIAPSWLIDGSNADGRIISKIQTLGRKPYILED